MELDFRKIDPIFQNAAKEKRCLLLEYEVYQILKELGFQTPQFVFIPKARRIRAADLAELKSRFLVLKIVSPSIVHKTDVGGVQFIKNDFRTVLSTIAQMLETVPGNYLGWSKKFGLPAERESLSLKEVENEIRGVLILEKVDYSRGGLGAEVLLGIRNSRAFGPVVAMGVGGLETEYWTARLREGSALAIGSAHLLRREEILPRLERLAAFEKLVHGFRSREPLISAQELVEAYFRFGQLAAHYSPFGKSADFVIEEAEVNPFVIRSKKLIPLDAMCRFSAKRQRPGGPAFKDVTPLLHPRSIAVIGVSEKMNIGHVILINILREGFPREKIYVVKPGLEKIEGCRCVPSIADLPETVDLFVLTLSADQAYDVMAELIADDKARSVIIIAGGMGEKKGTEDIELRIKSLLDESRRQGKPVPVVNGGNCLGVYSWPGKLDTTFIPEYKLRWPKGQEGNLVYISQSGAFMISRVSKMPGIVPSYAISLGNQIDLRASDYLNHLHNDDKAKIFAIYIEGFHAGDGLALASVVRQIARHEEKSVVVYKAGRTAEGRLATAGHTASVAGDYYVCRSVLEASGAIVAESILDFESFIKCLSYLAGKQILGKRVGLISNAGFECVIMSDSLGDEDKLELASFQDSTKKKLGAVLIPLGIERLQDIKNPLDLTPVAEDDVFAQCVEIVLNDENVDCAVVSPVPMTAALQTLPPGPEHGENLLSPEGIVVRLADIFRRTAKPFVVNIDAGAAYNPMADDLERAGVPVFRRSDEAVKFLKRYIHSRLRLRKIQE
jgi:acyl-CoA synthetase (NDP forming)